MHKRFLRKSILTQALVGGVLGLLVLVPSLMGFEAHPLLSLAGMGFYAVLIAPLGMIIENKMK